MTPSESISIEALGQTEVENSQPFIEGPPGNPASKHTGLPVNQRGFWAMELAKGSRKAGQKEDAFQKRVKNLLFRKYFWKSSMGRLVESQIFQVEEEGRFVFPGWLPVLALLSRVKPRAPGRGCVSAGEGMLGGVHTGGQGCTTCGKRSGRPPSACHSPLLLLCLHCCPKE